MPEPIIPAFGIFEGGGVKGAALAGAVAAAYEFGVRFRGVGGTSAGAVVAALYAAGYRTPHDLRNGMTHMPLQKFCGGYNGEPPETTLRRAVQYALEQAPALQQLGSRLGGNRLGLGWAAWTNREALGKLGSEVAPLVQLLKRLADSWGIYEPEELTTWLEERLHEGLNELNLATRGSTIRAEKRVTFGDLPKDVDLAIVATRLDRNNSLVVYRRDEYPYMSIAEAVRQSISIPFYFTPRSHEGVWHIDGGAASNFPAWLFARPLSEDRDPLPILGFRLVEPLSVRQAAAERDVNDLLSFVGATCQALLWAGDELQFRDVPRLHIIRLRTEGVNTTDFGLTPTQQEALFDRAMETTKGHLNDIRGQLRHDCEPELEEQLATVCRHFAEAIGHPGEPLTRPDGTKLARAAIMVPTFDPMFRRVIVTSNFEGDPDGDLVLPAYSGLSGVAWSSPRKLVWADLEVVRRAHANAEDAYLYAMPPDAQDKVRSRSQMMVAIAVSVPGAGRPIATLALDTDLRILDAPDVDGARVRERVEDVLVRDLDLLAPIIQRRYSL